MMIEANRLIAKLVSHFEPGNYLLSAVVFTRWGASCDGELKAYNVQR